MTVGVPLTFLSIVIAPHSESEGDVTPAMFHWDSLGADMVAVAAAQPSCGNGFVVMGDSMGAAAALTAMAQEPGFRDQVRGLVLMRPPNVWEARAKWKKVMAAAAGKREGKSQTIFLGSSETNLPPREMVAQVDVPVLLLGVKGDKVHPVESVEQLVAVLPKARSEVAESWEEAQAVFPGAAAAFYRECCG